MTFRDMLFVAEAGVVLAFVHCKVLPWILSMGWALHRLDAKVPDWRSSGVAEARKILER